MDGDVGPVREAEERAAWKKLAHAAARRGDRRVPTSIGIELDLARGCIVIAGRNGAGKSQLLSAAKDALGDKAILIQLHQLCELVRRVHASRTDIADMEAEGGSLPLAPDIVDHVKRIVGREYETIEWYTLELSATDGDAGGFTWSSDQSLVPHFRARYRGVDYSTLDMGLGELSVHILFWILEQYRDESGMTLLLDEPDAFLPPIGSARILARLQDLCRSREWDLIVSTHSEEMIQAACENDGLLVLRRSQSAACEGVSSWEHGSGIALELLSAPAIDLVLFCEDESGAALARSLLHHAGADRRATVVWKDGQGYLTALSRHLPRYERMEVKFGLVFDGDQRNRDGRGALSAGWQTIFLPTSSDPDTLFKGLASDPAALAARLQVPETTLVSWLDALEGADPHDWVNGLCDRSVRVAVLESLADLWVADHPDETAAFNAAVQSSRIGGGAARQVAAAL